MNVPSSLALSCSAHYTDLALSCGTNTLYLSLALSPGADPPTPSPGAHLLPPAPTTRFPDSFTQPRSTSCFSPAQLHAAPPTPWLWHHTLSSPHCPPHLPSAMPFPPAPVPRLGPHHPFPRALHFHVFLLLLASGEPLSVAGKGQAPPTPPITFLTVCGASHPFVGHRAGAGADKCLLTPAPAEPSGALEAQGKQQDPGI